MSTYIVLQNIKDSENDFSFHAKGEEIELKEDRANKINAVAGGPFVALKEEKAKPDKK